MLTACLQKILQESEPGPLERRTEDTFVNSTSPQLADAVELESQQQSGVPLPEPVAWQKSCDCCLSLYLGHRPCLSTSLDQGNVQTKISVSLSTSD